MVNSYLLNTFFALKYDQFFSPSYYISLTVQGLGPYSTLIKKAEKEIKDMAKKVNDLCGEY